MNYLHKNGPSGPSDTYQIVILHPTFQTSYTIVELEFSPTSDTSRYTRQLVWMHYLRVILENRLEGIDRYIIHMTMCDNVPFIVRC